jgi:hypothetical protein
MADKRGVALVLVDCQTGFYSERLAADFPEFCSRVAEVGPRMTRS